MNMQFLLQHYHASFTSQYGFQLNADQWSALNAMLGCRTGQYGSMHLDCPSCQWKGEALQSCGHRTCQQCQQGLAEQWLHKQTQKLLPVEYFMVTFTMPQALRGLFKAHQKICYSALFQACQQTLKQFASDDTDLKGSLGFTGVLHTHSRQLAYHPHIHFIVPAGAFDHKFSCWRKKSGKYLFRQGNRAKVFRAT